MKKKIFFKKKKRRKISFQEGANLAQQIGYAFFESSALKNDELEGIFRRALEKKIMEESSPTEEKKEISQEDEKNGGIKENNV